MLALTRAASTIATVIISLGAIIGIVQSSADGKPAGLITVLKGIGATDVVGNRGILATVVNGGNSLTLILLPQQANQYGKGIRRQLTRAGVKVSAISHGKHFTAGLLSSGQRIIAFSGRSRISKDLAHNMFSDQHSLANAVDKVGLDQPTEVEVGLFMKRRGNERIFMIVDPRHSGKASSAKLNTDTLDKIRDRGFVYAALTRQISEVSGRFGPFEGIALVGPHLKFANPKRSPPASGQR